MECGQIFLLACRHLQKKGHHSFIGQFENLCNVPTLGIQELWNHNDSRSPVKRQALLYWSFL